MHILCGTNICRGRKGASCVNISTGCSLPAPTNICPTQDVHPVASWQPAHTHMKMKQILRRSQNKMMKICSNLTSTSYIFIWDRKYSVKSTSWVVITGQSQHTSIKGSHHQHQGQSPHTSYPPNPLVMCQYVVTTHQMCDVLVCGDYPSNVW